MKPTIFTITFLLFAAMTVAPLKAQKFSAWSEPVNLGPEVNSTADDSAAVLTNNGRTLFFTSNRPGALGSEDIWVTTRLHRKDEWGKPVNLGPIINSTSMDRLRSISPDGRILLFQSNRPGGEGGNDIWASVRVGRSDSRGWGLPVNMGKVINTSTNEVAANYLFGSFGRDHKFFFSSGRAGGLGETDIYVSDIPVGGEFGIPANVVELNSIYNDTCFWIRDDGLELIFSSTRRGFNNEPGSFDLWASTRDSLDQRWSEPKMLDSAINSDFIEVNPQLSDNGETLIFTSGRPGGLGGQDIYITHRRRVGPRR